MDVSERLRHGLRRDALYRARHASGFLVAVLAFGVLACQRDAVTHYRIPKAGALAAATPAHPGADRPPPGDPGAAGSGDDPAPPAPTGSSALKWTLPAGWKQSPGGGMRYATLTPPAPGRVEVTVVVLAGTAGGEAANVNRWRSQIGLPPLADGDLASARQRIQSRAGPVSVYDFVGDGSVKSRVVAGLASAEGNTWFVKMSGDAGPVGAAKPAFIHLLESLRLDGPKN